MLAAQIEHRHDYRAKWGLPANYPMTAPDYAAQRSSFAKQIGLGRKAELVPVAVVAKPRAKRAAKV